MNPWDRAKQMNPRDLTKHSIPYPQMFIYFQGTLQRQRMPISCQRWQQPFLSDRVVLRQQRPNILQIVQRDASSRPIRTGKPVDVYYVFIGVPTGCGKTMSILISSFYEHIVAQLSHDCSYASDKENSMVNCNDIAMEELFFALDSDIVVLARKVMSYHIAQPEFDEIVQNVRINLWKSMQKKKILNYPAYIARIIRHEFIEYSRRLRNKSYRLILLSEEMSDPVEVFEKEEIETLINTVNEGFNNFLLQTISIPSLVKDNFNDLISLANVLSEHEMGLDKIHGSLEKQCLLNEGNIRGSPSIKLC